MARILNRHLREDLYDTMLARKRKDEPRESLESVKKRLQDQSKLRKDT